ncbi:MAG: hypothetical protein MZU84_04195 [Sphingobacterium sp.]|nr:hypothetical protein [Sphingobacterium sp.]
MRPAAARLGRAARRPQGRALRGLRRDGVRRAARRDAATRYDRYLVRLEEFRQSLRIIRQAVQGPARGADHGQGAAAHQAAGGRDLPRHRGAEGRARVLHRERRQVGVAVPVPRAAAVVLQPPGAAAARAGAPGGRRGRAHRHDRHRARGSGPVGGWQRRRSRPAGPLSGGWR